MLRKASSFTKDCDSCQWLANVDMYKYPKFNQNIPCGSRVMSIFTNLTDGQTHTVIIAGRHSSVGSDVAWESRGTAIDPHASFVKIWS